MDYGVLSDLLITKIHSVSTMYTEEKTNSKRRNRPLWAFVIKYEGETVYTSNGKNYISNINNIVILPKGCDYDWCCLKSGHFSIIEFDCPNVSSQILSFKIKSAEKFLNIIKRIEINRALKSPAYKLEELKDLYGLLLSLIKQPIKNIRCRQRKTKFYRRLNILQRIITKKYTTRTFLT